MPHFFPAGDMHFQSRFAPRMQYLSQSPPSQSCGLASVSEHLSLLVLVRLLLFFRKYLLLLHTNMAVITREAECFPHQNLEKKKKKGAAPTCSAFYLPAPERGAISIQMASHQGFYTFTLSKNAEQRSAFSTLL